MQAWIVAVDMGYGHQRAAYPFRDIAYERIITANNDAIVPPDERRLWGRLKGLYEGVSRFSNVPVIGPPLWRLYDRLQGIQPQYPFRDLSKPSVGSMRLSRLLQLGFAASVSAHTLEREDLPLLTTFFAVALAADHAGRRDVFCVVTDADINRVWVAAKPERSHIVYLVPAVFTRQRLLAYGVPPEHIHVTGFPLPQENVDRAPEDLKRRLGMLDAGGVLRRKLRELTGAGAIPTSDGPARPLNVAFAVGGAGAQVEIAHDILRSLAAKLREGSVHLHLIAGTRVEVKDQFRAFAHAQGLERELGRSVHVLCEPTKDEYFERFNRLARDLDVLWTKPSELCFYSALGLPIVLAPPLGAHEERNLDALRRLGAGQTQEDPRAAGEWLADWTRNGLLANSAVNGFLHSPRHGTENIKRVMFASDRSSVELRIGDVAP
jgi:UDP-N-acetylglucosamine:LPS N-acetylglucosamine transferase